MTTQEDGKSFYIWGGFAGSVNGSAPSVSPSGYRYSFKRGEWIELPSPKVREEEIFLGGSSAVVINDTMTAFVGGVNQDIFLKALQREAAIKEAVSQNDTLTEQSLRKESKEYMLQQPEWYKFNSRVLVYNSLRNNWEEIIVTPSTARAGAVVLHKNGVLYSIGGELKPGVRVAEVATIKLQ
jgi:sialate O-acetylesterase